MSRNLRYIDKLFRTKIDQYGEEPSPKVWEAIDKRLDKNKIVSISKKYNKLKWIAAVLLLCSAGMAMYILHIEKPSHDLVKNNIETKQQIEKNVTEVKANKNTVNNGSTINKNDDDKNNILKNIPNNSKRDSIERVSELSGRQLNKAEASGDTKKLFNTATVQNDVVHHAEKDKKRFTKSSNQKSLVVISATHSRHRNANVSSKTKYEIVTSTPQKKDVINLDATQTKIQRSGNLDDSKTFYSGVPVVLSSPQINNSRMQILPPMIPLTIAKDLSLKNTFAGKVNSKEKRNQINIIHTKPSKKSLFSATAFFTPEFVFDNIKSSHPEFREDNEHEIKKDEKLKTASDFGILIGYNFSWNWWLQSGIALFTKNTFIDSKTIYARPDRNGDVNFRLSCSSGSSYITLKSGASPVSGDSTRVSAENKLQYISIPFILKRAVLSGRFTLYPSVGLGLNILSGNKIETELSLSNRTENTINNVQGLKRSYVNASVSLGAAYWLSKNISLNLEPAATLGLSPINQNTPVKTKLNTLGLSAGVTLRL